MCSAACGDGVRPHTRDVVAQAVAGGRPMALSLNETCYDDLVHLGGRWPAGFGAGAGYVALETATNCPGAVKRFGNSVLVRAGQAGASARWAQFPTQSSGPCDNRARECRGMACAATGEGGRRSVFCTAHLEPRRHGPAVAAAQADEYLRLANGGETRIETTTAGDFNLTPAEVDARFAPLGYRAARTGPTFAGHGRSGSAPIDMIYRRGPAPASPPVATTTCDARASDHCYLVQAWEPAPVSVGG
jgi:endonuclease/exonuclease/phosphatase family metal-dependent hydrolase